MAKSGIYAILEFKKLDDLTPAALEQIKKDFPGDSYACIMVRRQITFTEAEAEQVVINFPKFTATSGNIYDQGGVKGSPPGSTNSL